jgi:NAD-dependent deacetylase
MVYFILQILKEDTLMEKKINKVVQMIATAKKIVIFTGAGVSTESGIPDFRSPGGLWTRFDPDDFTIDKFLSSGETRKKMWKILLEGGLMADAQPNAAHYAIAELEKMGKLSSVITQNVDNLHQKAGNDPAVVHELHGNMQWLVCLDCRERYPVELMIQKSSSEDYVPECRNCGGILKPDVIFFGEELSQKVLMQATYKAQGCDLFIIIGSSLVVYPAAYMPLYAKRACAGVVIINLGPTEQDDIADVIVDHSAGETMTKIMNRLKA